MFIFITDLIQHFNNNNCNKNNNKVIVNVVSAPNDLVAGQKHGLRAASREYGCRLAPGGAKAQPARVASGVRAASRECGGRLTPGGAESQPDRVTSGRWYHSITGPCCSRRCRFRMDQSGFLTDAIQCKKLAAYYEEKGADLNIGKLFDKDADRFHKFRFVLSW